MRKYFIGAKDGTGKAIIAEEIDSIDFHAANCRVNLAARELVGSGNYRVTAVNEMPAVAEPMNEPGGMLATLTAVETPETETSEPGIKLRLTFSEKEPEKIKASLAGRLITTLFSIADRYLKGDIGDEQFAPLLRPSGEIHAPANAGRIIIP